MAQTPQEVELISKEVKLIELQFEEINAFWEMKCLSSLVHKFLINKMGKNVYSYS